MKRSEMCEEFLKANEVNCCSLKDPEGDEGRFSWRGCDCCNTSLGCTVFECIGFDPKRHEVTDLGDVCHECLCYFANGDDGEVES